MNIVILNQYCENRGDEAAGEALVYQLIQRSDVDRIDIIYNSAYALNVQHQKVIHHNEDLRLKLIGKRAIAQYLLLRKSPFYKFCFFNNVMENMAKTISEADVVYITPCGASIGIYKDWCFLLRIVFAIYEKKTPIFYLNTIGKSGNFFFDLISKWVLKKSKIYVREKKSQIYINEIGLPAKRGIDTAFLLPNQKVKNRNNTLGLVLTQLSWHPNFRHRNIDKEVESLLLPQIVSFCNKTECVVELIPHLASESEFVFYENIKKELESSIVGNSKVIVRYDVLNASDYDKALAQCSFVLGMRYHSIVLSAKNTTPFLAICYENKMLEVCRYTDCEQFYVDLQEENPKYGEVFTKLMYISEHNMEIRHHLSKTIDDDFKKLAKLPLEELKHIT